MAKLRIFESGNPSNYIDIDHLRKSKMATYFSVNKRGYIKSLKKIFEYP